MKPFKGMYRHTLMIAITFCNACVIVDNNSINNMMYDMIYLTAVVLTTDGSSTVHIYTQTIHRTTQ